MRHFKIYELYTQRIATKRGAYNIPTQRAVDNIIAVAENILDPLQDAYDKKIHILSGYRTREYNRVYGGVEHSAHIYGEAVDIVPCPRSKANVKELFELIIKLDLPFDQLALENEGAWVHVSYRRFEKNRKLMYPYWIRDKYYK